MASTFFFLSLIYDGLGTQENKTNRAITNKKILPHV